MQTAKVGEVVTTYPNRHSARVKFSDQDDKVSAELQVLSNLEMPNVNDSVLCIYISKSDGFIIGTVNP